MTMDQLYVKICELLETLGVTANYAGFTQLEYALQLCAEQPDRLRFVTKQVYPDVAKHFHTSSYAVERNLRTVGKVIWKESRMLLEALARRPLSRRPTNTELLAILTVGAIVVDQQVFGK